ncbi:MAG: aminotransferase class V-fold PLP-dependent enzyme [Betaproteobacteria bacterium]|nr:aminotransferase class V-fold PLP-dependent enzyme [Betaproteobacteria bacterium]MBV9361426.1 aminotransferase class V-fold PLP-dependent enzyme [Betaproteobacteria bacterium]
MSAHTLDEDWLRANVWPRFSRALARKEIYLANHSLGRPPDRMAEDVRTGVDAWYRDMDGAWDLWLETRDKWRALTAKLVGAPRADCIVPKTSAGQGLRAVLNALPGKPRVATSDGEFDSIDFILRVYREQGKIELKITPWQEISAEGADLVVISTVMFRTGEVVKHLPKLIHDAHAKRALVLLDVYHHAGVIPLDLAALEADFAIGGSYKYLRGGPGACWLYVRPGLVDSMRTLDTGRFAKKDVFSYLRPEPPEFGPGGDAWLESTPPVLGCFQALAGLEFTLEIGIDRLRAYSMEQKALLASLLPEVTGADKHYGAFVTLKNKNAARLGAALGKQAIKTDVRGEYLRLCPDILNTRAEIERAAATLRNLLVANTAH